MPLSGPFVGIGIDPRVASASAETSRRVRVYFNEPMTVNAAIADPASYTITEDVGSDARTVDAVVLEPGAAYPTYALLYLDGDLTIGTLNYNVAVDLAVEDAAGNGLDAAFDDADFDGAHLPIDDTHCTSAKDRLAAQFRKPNIEALVCLLADRAQDLDQVLVDMFGTRSLDTAYGAQLDRLGETLGYARNGKSDADYRLRLRARAQFIASRGRPDELLALLLFLDNGFTVSEGGSIVLLEHYPATAILNGTLVLEDQQQIGMEFAYGFLHPAAPAGVRLIHEFWETDVILFQMQEDGGPAPPAGSGMTEVGGAEQGHLREAV